MCKEMCLTLSKAFVFMKTQRDLQKPWGATNTIANAFDGPVNGHIFTDVKIRLQLEPNAAGAANP